MSNKYNATNRKRRLLIKALEMGGTLRTIHNPKGEQLYLLSTPTSVRQWVDAAFVDTLVQQGILVPVTNDDGTHFRWSGVRYVLPIKPDREMRTPVSFTLGGAEKGTPRLRSLREIASRYGGLSAMLQQIADGDLLVIRKEQP